MFSFSNFNEVPIVKRFIKLTDVPQKEKYTINSITKMYSEKLKKEIVELRFNIDSKLELCMTLPVRYIKFSQTELDSLVGKEFTYNGKNNYGVHDIYFS